MLLKLFDLCQQWIYYEKTTIKLMVYKDVLLLDSAYFYFVCFTNSSKLLIHTGSYSVSRFCYGNTKPVILLEILVQAKYGKCLYYMIKLFPNQKWQQDTTLIIIFDVIYYLKILYGNSGHVIPKVSTILKLICIKFRFFTCPSKRKLCWYNFKYISWKWHWYLFWNVIY